MNNVYGITPSLEVISGAHEAIHSRTRGGFGPFATLEECNECLRMREFDLHLQHEGIVLPYFGREAEFKRLYQEFKLRFGN